MDNRRFIVALALSLAVVFIVQRFFMPAQRPNTAVAHVADSARAAASPSNVASPTAATTAPTPATNTVAAPTTAPNGTSGVIPPVAPVIRPETAVVVGQRDSGATYVMSNIGAAPASVVMNAYPNRAHPERGHPLVNLAAAGNTFIKYQIVTNAQAPADLSTVPFTATREGDVLTYRTAVAGADLAIRYTFVPDSYTVHVSGQIANVGKPYLLVNLPSTFTATESDTADDRNALAYAYLSKRDGARNVLFRSLDPGEKTLVTGPLTWVAAKSKYFVVGMLAPKGGSPFTEATLVGGPRTSKVATNAEATVVVPLTNGAFAFDLYTGPQALKRLEAQGRSFDEVNPYGWAFLHGVLQPIATAVTRLVLWMHVRLALSYGMVLVLLGILVRLVLWPLNQSAMRTSLKMQELQPKLQAVQERYKNDLEKQRAEVMKVYSEHGMNPLSPILGCLPMLLPMPILFALFFVFRSTIEFRGVHFLWLSDLSAHDPFYILPIIMGVSMYLLSWIGMRNAPPNPQAKMMSYMMPAIFVVFLGRAASGLNLYYAVQNLAALPQQWLIARERSKGKSVPQAVRT